METDRKDTQNKGARKTKASREKMGSTENIRPEELLSMCGMAKWLGLDKRTIRRMVLRCELPQPIKIGRLRFWKAGRVAAWMDRLAEEGERESERMRRKIQAFAQG